MLEYKPQAEKNAIDKTLQAFAQTRLGGKLFITVFPEIDRRLMPLTRGRLSTGLGQPVVLLHVRGAKSGIERTRRCWRPNRTTCWSSSRPRPAP